MQQLAKAGKNIPEAPTSQDRTTMLRVSRGKAKIAKDDLQKTHAFFNPRREEPRESNEQLIVREPTAPTTDNPTSAVEKQQIASQRTLRGIIPEPPSSRSKRKAIPSQQFQAVQEPAPPIKKVGLEDLFADGREDIDHRSSISPLLGLTNKTVITVIAEAKAEAKSKAKKKTPVAIPKVNLLDPVLPKLGKTVQIDPRGLPKTAPPEYATKPKKDTESNHAKVQSQRVLVSRRTKTILAAMTMGTAIGLTALGTLEITGKIEDVNSAINKVLKTPNK